MKAVTPLATTWSLSPSWKTFMPAPVRTCGIAAGTPGAGGTKIRYSHPGFLDGIGADFPGLTLIAAHFGWPWFMECLAIALHKSNVFIELSGWAPKYLPAEVQREIGRRLNAQLDRVVQRVGRSGTPQVQHRHAPHCVDQVEPFDEGDVQARHPVSGR